MAENRKRRVRWILGIVAAVVLVVAGGLVVRGVLTPEEASADVVAADSTGTVAVGSDEEVDEVAKVPVELAVVGRRAIAAYYRAASVVEADRLIDLVAKISGRVQKVNAEEGDWVSSGDVLAELENARERIQLEQADLKLAEQERNLGRNEAMLSEGLISDQQYDEARRLFDLARTDRDLARINFEETLIRAPFTGRITQRQVVLGQHIAPATSLFTLGDFDPLRVRVHLPEAVARKVEAGQKVLVTPESRDEPLPARVERVAPVVDPASSTVRVTLLMDENEDQASVGGFVKVRITTDTRHSTLAVPKLSLVEEGGLRSLFVAEADTVRKVEVNTGIYDESHVEILDGVSEGDFVVCVGQGGLRTGSHIQALNAAEVGWGGLVEEDSRVGSPGDTVVAASDTAE